MYHAGAQDFNPASPFADVTAFSATLETRNIDFDRRLCEREEAWTETNLTRLTEQLFDERLERPFQVGHRDVFIDDEPFDLQELVRMGRVVLIPTIHFPRADDANRFTVCE